MKGWNSLRWVLITLSLALGIAGLFLLIGPSLQSSRRVTLAERDRARRIHEARLRKVEDLERVYRKEILPRRRRIMEERRRLLEWMHLLGADGEGPGEGPSARAILEALEVGGEGPGSREEENVESAEPGKGAR